MQTKTSKWMWYFGDFEIFHSHKLHARRSERGVIFPVQWFIPEVYHNIFFRKEGILEKAETICVTVTGEGFIRVNGKLYPCGVPVEVPAGSYRLSLAVNNPGGLPCAYVEGETIKSDESRVVTNGNNMCTQVGLRDDYTDKNVTPETFCFSYKKIEPASINSVDGGVLYDYGKETFATIEFKKLSKDVVVYYGETEMEAVDTKHSYIFEKFTLDKIGTPTFAKGFRYLYIPDVKPEEVQIEVQYEYLPVAPKSKFHCDNEMLNRIWDVSAYTFELNSREFYMDGIKRDRWVWAGDAYQSYFINRYLCFDEDIVRRTTMALGGKDTIYQHLNNIPDYTFYWIIGIYDYYEMTGDEKFLRDIFPRMTDFMEFTISRLDDKGFVTKVGTDWIFVDWADMDKDGAVCAEQILILRALEGYVKCGTILGQDVSKYSQMAEGFKEKIDAYFWCEEKGAYIDTFESGKKNVTRHANIFAILFGYATEEQKQSIIDNVILNDQIPQIKTPYFKFYELESMCAIDRKEYVFERILNYWGAMVEIGATTMWEEFSPDVDWKEQLGMYGRKYGKSLCHAWGASPIYLLGRYYLGVRPTSAAYKTFEVKPHLQELGEVDAIVPIKDGSIMIQKKDNKITIKADKDGGVLVYNDKQYILEKNIAVTVDC